MLYRVGLNLSANKSNNVSVDHDINSFTLGVVGVEGGRNAGVKRTRKWHI